jgi:hypothetical protein
MRIIVFFFIVFTLLLSFTTFTNQPTRLATGWGSFSIYGWPEPWLHVHVTDKTAWVNGKREPGERTTERSISWQPFMMSAAACEGIALALSAPVYFWFSRRP